MLSTARERTLVPARTADLGRPSNAPAPAWGEHALTMQREIERKIERRIRLWIVEQEREQRREALRRRAAAVRRPPRNARRK
jgi:hypothetical protein